MFLMVVSGLAALVQSITISLGNTSWIVHLGFEACTAQDCGFTECIELKRNLDQPSGKFQSMVFGYNLIGVPRTIMHELPAG
jgi:hypothetical protein